MSQRIDAIRADLPWYRNMGKVLAAGASTGAAVVSILSFLYSYGVLGESESHKTIGTIGVSWVGVQPRLDTAWAVGDTLHLAATVTDKNGAVLIGVRPTWSSENPEVATALPDGSVIAHGPGRTTITVTAGDVVARAHVLVRQRPAAVMLGAGDSSITIAEGARLALRAHVLDARGHEIPSHAVAWSVDDTSVARTDSAGVITGEVPGRTIVTAQTGDVSGRVRVTVRAAPAEMAAVAGGAQRATAGSALPQPVVVRVTSRRGQPVEGSLVRFHLADARGRVQPDSMRTDADGRARAAWTLAPLPGRQALLATVENVDSALTVLAEAEPTAAATRVTTLAEAPAARAGDTIPETVGVRVTDSAGRALVDVPVSFTALDGGTARAVEARTDSAGVARARWALGPRAGRQRLRVQVGSAHLSDVQPLVLEARALAGTPSVLAAVSGDAQKASAGSALKQPIVLRLLDARGNGVADAPVSLVASAGEIADAAPRTDSTGTLRVKWTLGRVVGAHQLSVKTEGIAKPLRLTATALPGAPANVTFDDPATPTSTRGARKLVVLVADEHGNPVPNARVQLSASAGRVSPARAVSDEKGRVAAQWTPGSAGGEQKVVATVASTGAAGTHVARVPAASDLASPAPAKAVKTAPKKPLPTAKAASSRAGTSKPAAKAKKPSTASGTTARSARRGD